MEFKIKSLLEKFFEGNSSLAEERELKNFFLKNELTEGFEIYSPLFQYFEKEKSMSLESSGFRRRVIDSIISDLTEKYFEGETSVEEEQTLKAYFSGELVSEHLKTYQPIFDFSEAETELTLGDGFDSKLQTGLIKSILEKYFEGETSVEEEQELKNYFSGNEIAKELVAYQALFEFYKEESSQEVSRAFDLKLEKKLQSTDSQPVIRRMNSQMWRAAAMIAFVVGALWLIDFGNEPASKTTAATTIDWSKYEPKDPEEAYQKTMAALAMVSTKMEEGQKQTLKGISKINRANKAAGL